MGGMNTYGYVGGNPVNNIDSSGLYCQSAGGTTHCAYPNGPEFSFPTPPGWKDFNENSMFYHKYDITVPIGNADPKCVSKNIADNPTPGNPNPATPQGTWNDASPEGTPGFLTPNPVMSYVTTDQNGNQVVVNVSLDGHSLTWGYVARQVNGSWVHNYGEGTAFKQSKDSPVADMISGVWVPQTQSLIDGCGCQ